MIYLFACAETSIGTFFFKDRKNVSATTQQWNHPTVSLALLDALKPDFVNSRKF